MYISIVRYAGMAGKLAEAGPLVQQGLVPVMQAQPGFHGYAAIASEQGDIVALGIWESADALTNSREKILAWVSANMADLGEVTERFQGVVGPHAIVAPQSGGQGQSLYCMVRKAENLPPAELRSPITEETLVAIRKVPGFHGAYWLRSADDQRRGASILFFDNREHTNTAHEAALAIMKQRLPEVGVRVAASGQTAVLAMA